MALCTDARIACKENRMSTAKTKRNWRTGLKMGAQLIAAVLGLALIIMWTTGVFTERIPPGTVQYEPGFALPDQAEIFTVEKKTFNRRIDVTGTVFSEETIHIAARISAYVEKVHAGAGSKVSEGDLLVSLDDREIRQQLSSAEADLDQAQTEYHRTKRLFDSGAATHRDYTTAQSNYRRALARKKELTVMLGFTEMRAPIDGVVTDREIEAGDLAAPGQVLMTLYNPKAMRLEVPVPVRLSDRVTVGDRVSVKIEYPARLCDGEVTEIVSQIDPAARTRTVKVQLPTQDSDILPGTFGRIWIEAAPEEGIFAPKSAVYSIGQLTMVQHAADGRVTRRLVKTGAAQGDSVEILSGLNHGDSVLVYPVPLTPADRNLSLPCPNTED